MKTIKTTLAVLLSLASLGGCRNVEQDTPDVSSVKTVRFTASAADTRTAFDEPVDGVYQTRWTANDSDVLLSLNYGKAEPSAVTPSSDGKTASFEASFDAASAASPYTFYAVSPASAARAISPSRSAWSVYIAAEQKPSPQSVDEASQLLVAKSAATSTLPDEVDLHFSHLTAYGRISLNNLALGDAAVRKVDLVFSTAVVGEWYWGEDGTLTSNGGSHTITLDTDASCDLWFACAPVDVSGATMRLTVFTDLGELSKEITFPEGRKFMSGKVARFSVDMAGIEFQMNEGYYPVTNAGILQPGDKILMVNTSGTYALGRQITLGTPGAGTPGRLARSIVVTDGRIVSPGLATVLTLYEGSEPKTWAFRTDTGYLSAEESGNALTESTEITPLSSWKLAVSTDASLVFPSGRQPVFISFNPSLNGFACYPVTELEEGMEQLVLYRWGSRYAPAAEEDPLTTQSEYGCYMAGSEWTYAKGSDQILRSYDSDGKLKFALVNASEKEQLVVSGYDPSLVKEDEAVVTVSWRKGLQVVMYRTLHLRVVKEDGSKVWLGDGTGQGFILKK